MMGERDLLREVWPQFELRIDIGDVRLEVPTDEQTEVLLRRGTQPEAVLPTTETHFVTWISNRAPDDVQRQRAADIRAHRDLIRRPGWTLDLAMIVNNEPVGMQSLSGFDQWPHRRNVGTASWLLNAFQHKGLALVSSRRSGIGLRPSWGWYRKIVGTGG
jgi:hypothetical protein